MKSVYTGDDKVAEFESYDELRVGDSKPAFIYEGSELVYPNPVKDGLVLWYDFSGRTNADGQRGIAEDLSGNGNHGTLQNFNFTPESGYDKNKLLFDGVDDTIITRDNPSLNIPTPLTLECTIKLPETIDHIGELIVKGTTFSRSQNYSLSYHTNGALYFEIGTSNPTRTFVFFLSDSFRGKKIFLQGVCRNDGLYIYINGEQVSYSPFEIQNIPLITSRMGISVSPDKKAKADMFSAKIYNRPLTPEEIAHNYAIEKERFGIE